MIYLIDPREAEKAGCKPVAWPLYGIPCYDYCRLFT